MRKIDIGPGGGSVIVRERHQGRPGTLIRYVQRNSRTHRLEGGSKLKFTMNLEQEELRFTQAEQLLAELGKATPTAARAAAEKAREKTIAAAATKVNPPAQGSAFKTDRELQIQLGQAAKVQAIGQRLKRFWQRNGPGKPQHRSNVATGVSTTDISAVAVATHLSAVARTLSAVAVTTTYRRWLSGDVFSRQLCGTWTGPQQQGSSWTCGEERKALRPCPVPGGHIPRQTRREPPRAGEGGGGRGATACLIPAADVIPPPG